MQVKPKRKYIRIALPANFVSAFQDAKIKTEMATMVTLSDSQFAAMLIQASVAKKNKG